MAAMGGADAIVFTGGIGENSPDVRRSSCNNLGFLGIELDEAKNTSPEKEKPIHSLGARVKLFVVPTNEELMIALDTATICGTEMQSI
jgi:acetate kinase